VTQGGGLEMWDCRRVKHGGRVVASPFVAISWFHALFDACLSGPTAGLASSATTWCMRRRLASLETAKSHIARPGLSSTRRPHACHHSISTIPVHTAPPACLAPQSLSPVEPLSSHPAHSSSTLFIPPTRRVPCCCRS
jgi:hypothetical protein